jgi:hypothetical protein
MTYRHDQRTLQRRKLAHVSRSVLGQLFAVSVFSPDRKEDLEAEFVCHSDGRDRAAPGRKEQVSDSVDVDDLKLDSTWDSPWTSRRP